MGTPHLVCRVQQGHVIVLDEKKKLAFHLRVLRYRFSPRSIPGLKIKGEITVISRHCL